MFVRYTSSGDAFFGLVNASRFSFTSSAVNGLPLENFTPLRIVNVQVRKSGDEVAPVASTGVELPWGPAVQSGSQTGPPMMVKEAGSLSWSCEGSRRSFCIATVKV